MEIQNQPWSSRLWRRIRRPFRKAYWTIRKTREYRYLRRCGVETGWGEVHLEGWPIIQKCPGSRIILREGVTLVSRCEGNVAGVNHPVILATLTKDAVIELTGCGISGSSICAATRVQIGRHSGLGANSSIYDTDFHRIDPVERRRQRSVVEADTAPVILGEDVWVAANVLILKGVTIGDAAVVGAGSVVTRSVAPFEIVAGNPAKHVGDVRQRTERPDAAATQAPAEPIFEARRDV